VTANPITDFKIVGKPYHRLESRLKVTGQAVYTADLTLPGMVYGAILRSPHAHAKVTRIDKSAALKVPGVLGVLLPQDVPQQLFNCSGSPPSPLLIKDERILTDHPLYAGDRIAALAAETPQACREGLEKLQVEYELLPAVFKIKEALAEKAVRLQPELAKTNIIKKIKVTQGDVAEGFRMSDFVFEEEFYTPAVQHVPLELTGCVCSFTSEGKLTVWSTSQTPFQDRRILAELLNMTESDIRVIKPFMGGGFGARQQLHNQPIGALLSRLVLRPVKIMHTREEDMYASAVRHESVIRLKVGVNRDGKFQAVHAQVFMNAGPYTTHSAVVMAATSRKFQYRVPHYLFEGHCVLTNAPVAGAMRGFGNPQMTFARELLLDRIARKLNLDPVRMRLENHLQAGDTFPGGSPLVWSCAIEDCAQGAEKIKEEIDEQDGKQNRAGLVEAWGMAFGCHTSGPSSKEGLSSCIISANDDGTVQLMTGSADIGQGSETTLCQVAAEELGLEVADITIHAADTLTTPYDTGTFASSQMYISGNAVQKAAAHLLQNIKAALGNIYRIAADKISCAKGRITLDLHRETKTLTFKQAVKKIIFDDKGAVLIGHASFKAEESPPPFAVCWAKVAWDRRTNNVEVKHVIEAVDVGTAINPEVVIGQVQGGIAMGFGYAMLEQVELDPRAVKPISSDLLHYKVPLSLDAPQAHVYIARSYEPTGPFGAKSVGEAATVPVAAAIANAVAHATGEEIKALPLSQLFVPAKLRIT